MAILMQIDRLTKSVGDRILFSDVTIGISEGDKIGLIAKNGTGKTTLLRCITGIDSPDSGTVTKRDGVTVGFLEQSPCFPDNATIST
ncbi:MAG: ATP-binding cassette domain-containing protein, partial [Muribaculaceae bacterium]|nr:ATP-binding cassette domain-containing protein [Muribaculaceae bacterium]